MTRAIADGVAVRIAGNDVIYPGQQTAVTFFSDRFIKNRRELAERFMLGYLRGVRVYVDALKEGRLAGPNASEVIAILTKYTPIKDAGLFRHMVPIWVDPNGEVSIAGLRKDLDFFRELGLIERKDSSVDAVVDSSFAKGPWPSSGHTGRWPTKARPVRLDQGERQTPSAPSPLVGEGWGGGGACRTQARTRTTPTPNPSPQGGGEYTESVAPWRINLTATETMEARGAEVP